MKTQARQSPLHILISLGAAIIIWIALAPRQLGGSVTYIIVDGNSMEPRFHFGDLVLVREQPVYQIGDAVTYQNADMGSYVFHRIVSIQADRFILQGDHNTWQDDYHPVQGEIIGKLWIHIPAAGKAIQWVREPLGLALGCGSLGGIMMAGMILNPSQKGKRRAKTSAGMGGYLEGGLYFSGLVAVIFLGVSIFAFTRPLVRPAGTIQYQQDAYFMYSAAGTTDVYDSNTIQPGEPIFPRLTCMLNIGLVYNITGTGIQSAAGSHQFIARVLDEKSGWQRTFPLNAETAFNGTTYTSQAGLDLCQIEALVASVEQQTGLHPGSYTLEVTAHTTVLASLQGKPVSDGLDSILKFQFDKVNFHLATDANENDPLHTFKPGSMVLSESMPNTMNILGMASTVQSVRILGLFGLALSILGCVFVGLFILQGIQSDPAELIRLKFRGLLMDVHNMKIQKNLPYVDVASVDDLARLAERQNTMIAHVRINNRHYYFVQSNGTMYRHILGGESAIAHLQQTQPRLHLPERIKSNYVDAIPVDNHAYNYRVDLRQNQYTQPEEEPTMLLRRIKL